MPKTREEHRAAIEQSLTEFKKLVAEARGRYGRDFIRGMQQGKLLDALDANRQYGFPTDCLPPNINMEGAKTGRMQCKEPNVPARSSEHPMITITLSSKDYQAVMHKLGKDGFTFRDGAHIQPVEATKDVSVELLEAAEKIYADVHMPAALRFNFHEVLSRHIRPLLEKRDAEIKEMHKRLAVVDHEWACSACDGTGTVMGQVKVHEDLEAEIEKFAKHMTWVLDRLVNLYRENEHTDYITVGRRLVDAARAAEEKS